MKTIYRLIMILLLLYSAWTVKEFNWMVDHYDYLTHRCLDIALDSYFIGCMGDQHGTVRGEACKVKAKKYVKGIQHVFDQVDQKMR